MTKFKNSNITISKVYTKSGDKGKTFLIGGEKVYKDDIRVVAYGGVDELIVSISKCLSGFSQIKMNSKLSILYERLISIRNELFNLGTMLAAIGGEFPENTPCISISDVKALENDIDTMNKELHSLDSFVLPGENILIINIHEARVICRRVEQNIVSVLRRYNDINPVIVEYINRLSDYLFVASRWICKQLDMKEELWDPNKITSNKK